MNRPRYKDLYLREQAAHQATLDRWEELKHELRHLKTILAEEGVRVARDIEDGKGSVYLAPLPYECLAAYIDATGPMVRHTLVPYYARAYHWRGRPIVRR